MQVFVAMSLDTMTSQASHVYKQFFILDVLRTRRYIQIRIEKYKIQHGNGGRMLSALSWTHVMYLYISQNLQFRTSAQKKCYLKFMPVYSRVVIIHSATLARSILHICIHCFICFNLFEKKYILWNVYIKIAFYLNLYIFLVS